MGVIKGMYRINSLTQRVDLIKLKISFCKKKKNGKKNISTKQKKGVIKISLYEITSSSFSSSINK